MFTANIQKQTLCYLRYSSKLLRLRALISLLCMWPTSVICISLMVYITGAAG